MEKGENPLPIRPMVVGVASMHKALRVETQFKANISVEALIPQVFNGCTGPPALNSLLALRQLLWSPAKGMLSKCRLPLFSFSVHPGARSSSVPAFLSLPLCTPSGNKELMLGGKHEFFCTIIIVRGYERK